MNDIEDAMKNIDTWVVDWDMNLTAKEIERVRTPEWREGLTFKVATYIQGSWSQP